jgi:hypothetical protein
VIEQIDCISTPSPFACELNRRNGALLKSPYTLTIHPCTIMVRMSSYALDVLLSMRCWFVTEFDSES